MTNYSGALGIGMQYDPLGRLWRTNSTSTRDCLYDGDDLVAEYNSSGAVVARFVHGPGVDNPLVWYDSASVTTASRRFLYADRQGSIVAVSDSAGALLGANSYDDYGIPGAANTGRFQYTGQAWITSLGMYYYKARIYSPTLGRFMQTDPIGYGDGMNLYRYAANDPVNNSDPTGMACWGVRINGGGGPVGPGEIVSTARIEQRCFDETGVNFGQDWSSAYQPGGRNAEGPREVDIRCYGPPEGPKGISRSNLKAQARINANLAGKHNTSRYGFVRTIGWFHANLKSGGPYDYKQHDSNFEEFGNYNYGVMGAAAGIPDYILLRAAGRNQMQNKAANSKFGDWLGGPPYGDDPRDQAQIKNGISDYRNGCL